MKRRRKLAFGDRGKKKEEKMSRERKKKKERKSRIDDCSYP